MHGLALLSCAALAVLAAAPRSQVAPVPASGCAQSTWPTATGSPRLGQQVDFA